MANEMTPVKGYPHFSFESPDFDAEVATLSAELTEEEANCKEAKYWKEGIPEVPEEMKRGYGPGGTMDLSKAFMPTEAGEKFYTPDWNYGTEYCVMPNGIGFATMTKLYEGISPDEFVNFFTNFNPPGDLWYKSWCPTSHYRHYNDVAIEDVGLGGPSKVQFLHIIPPSEVGIDKPMQEYVPDAALTLLACSAVYPTKDAVNHLTKLAMPQVEMAYFRVTPQGVEVRMCFWAGCHLMNGQIIQYQTASEEYMRIITEHVVFELLCMERNIREFNKDWNAGYYND